ncbi:hypothetical protein [Nocardia sp. XZ_19_369]|uniref:hypothetical protein n=1 Tax=Nocardia sp. XZ_19_369 TaxID=2769487 RepID=UPI00188F5234|nr:hypothetical protein [Nocardia sp. XZ_19_369]
MKLTDKDTIDPRDADEPLRTALDHIAYRVRNADKLPDKRAADRMVQHAPQAMQIAAYATEVLNLYWRAIDEAIATGRLACGDVKQIPPLAEQQSLLADWALTHARAYEGDGLIDDIDIVLSTQLGLLQLGIDPAVLLPPK